MVQTANLKYYGIPHIDKIPELQTFSSEERFAIKVVSHVLPFRTNNYIVEELIDWNDAPNDPMFRLSIMQKELLESSHFDLIADSLKKNEDKEVLTQKINQVRASLNPHPSGQLAHNVPIFDGVPVPGIQHKYKETALLFPSAGQSCFTYCTFCFRWPQFIGDKELKFATNKQAGHLDYLKHHKEITDVLITGGDPLTMRAKHLAHFIKPLLEPGFEHIQNIRIGSKVLAFWPYRFTTDNDADEYLELFELVQSSGKHMALMAHFNHWKELETTAVQTAIKRILSTGTVIRCQSPLLKHINDDAAIWQRMWMKQVNLGMIPYYMFVERDTGPKGYYELPLEKTFEIFKGAWQNSSGLARTARGPSMSATPGKVCVEDISTIAGEKVFHLKFLQGRNPDWCNRIFYAKYDPEATWLDDLVPAFGDKEFFYDKELRSGLKL